MIKKFGDAAIAFTQRTSDDEYHATMTHQANTVGMWMVPIASMVVGAVLAWVLRGPESMWAALAIVPALSGQMAGNVWMKNYAPRPKAVSPRWYLAIGMVFIVLMFLGIVYNTYFGGERDVSVVISMVVGILVGITLAGWLVPKSMQEAYDSDVARLEASLED
ncbi:hypothetical protein QP027_06815 [Corynebacterium breve]|uniref:Uncharacterized protein n=1 Tax=Corynebacterium breve TaxID=3049799 RepID=A0ABY8VH37_9CORY|nr:hypothetical protein [Corynebacterium breve]WIM66845.1 hypothetical protein QP027_06815 [Corynebacterium breve]